MSEIKTLISNASSYAEIGEFWDIHDLSDYWDHTKPAEFEVDLKGSSTPLPAFSTPRE